MRYKLLASHSFRISTSNSLVPPDAIRLAFGTLVLLALCGCLSTVPIKAEDKNVLLPAVRVVANLDVMKQGASMPHPGYAFEFGIAGTSGSSRQSLGTYEQIIFNNKIFSGPQTVRNNFDYLFAEALWRKRKFFWEGPVGIEYLVGVGASSLDLSVASSALSASRSYTNLGILGGIGLIGRLRPSSSLQARAAVFNTGESGSMARFELAIVESLDEHTELRLGYTDWIVNGQGSTSQTNSSSGYDLRFSGLAITLIFDYSNVNSGDQVHSEQNKSN